MVVILLLVTILSGCSDPEKDKKYDSATELLKSGKYLEAAEAFDSLDGYKDSEEKAVEAKDLIYDKAKDYYDKGEFMRAAKEYISLGEYKDSKLLAEKAKEEQYNVAINYFNNKEYINAANEFYALDGYKDSKEKIDEAYTKQYDLAINYMKKKKYQKAYDSLSDLGDYKDSNEIMQGFVYMPTSIVEEEEDEDQGEGDHTITIKYDDQGRIVAATVKVGKHPIDKYVVNYNKKKLETMDHYGWDYDGKKTHPEHFKFVNDTTIDVDVIDNWYYRNDKETAKYRFKDNTTLIQNENGSITEYRVSFDDEGYLKTIQRNKFEGEDKSNTSPTYTLLYENNGNYIGSSNDTVSGVIPDYLNEVVGYSKNKKEVVQDNVRLLLFIEEFVPRLN